MTTIYKLYVFEDNEWLDTSERGTKDYLLALMSDCPQLYADVKYKFIKCKDQSPIDRQVELCDLLNNYVRQ